MSDALRLSGSRAIVTGANNGIGVPVDIAKVILCLASDDAVFVSGTGIVVDGGSSRTPARPAQCTQYSLI